MSFTNLKKDELLVVAETFAVPVENGANKADIIGAIADSGVTWDQYEDVFGNKEEETKSEPVVKAEPTLDEPEEKEFLIKMTRVHPVYEVRGYRFTKRHPYVLVKKSDVDYLVEVIGGFKLASPTEVEEYYS